MPQHKSLKKSTKKVAKKAGRKPKRKSQKGGGDPLVDFLSAGIENLSLNNNEVDKLMKDIKKMKVTTKKGAKTAFEKLLAARGKQGQKRKSQRGGAKLSEADIKKYSKIVELEEYEGDTEDDYGLEIYDELVEQGKGYDICRGKIDKGYIYGTFNNRNGQGFLASIKGEYVGFIVYYMKKGDLYLDLVCAAKNAKTKGIPLGQLLISKMEQYAKKNKIKTIRAHAVTPALPFYKATGWKTTGPAKDDKHPISKSIGVVKKVAQKKAPTKKPKATPKKAPKKPVKKAKKVKKKGFFARLFNL